MKNLVLMCSPRMDGVCSSIAGNIEHSAGSAGHEVDILNIYQKNLEMCDSCGQGWGACPQGHCVKNDDMQMIYSAMKDANVLIFITPVYWHDMPEHLKALMDRIRRCDLRTGNHWLSGKKAMIAAVSKGTGNGIVRCIEHLGYILSLLEINVMERLPVTDYSKTYMLDTVAKAAIQLIDFSATS